MKIWKRNLDNWRKKEMAMQYRAGEWRERRQLFFVPCFAASDKA